MTFREILGHRSNLWRVSRAIGRGTLPPSLLFGGPEGVGKRTVALALAQALNCERVVAWTTGDSGVEGAPGVDACGLCVACRRIAAGKFPEVMVIAPDDSGAIKIFAVRELLDRVGYRPFEGRRRVVILDNADLLRVEAQNALLKTLEEPPDSTMFVLVSSRPDALLPTVRSRCPQFRFGPLPTEIVAAVLVARHGFDERRALVAAIGADGSVGQALAANAESVASTRQVAEQVLKTVARGADVSRRLHGARVLAERGDAPKRRGSGGDRAFVAERLSALAQLLRDVSVVASRADQRWLANADRQSILTELAMGFDPPRLTRAFAAVDRARQALERNVSPKVVADWLVFQL